MQQTGQARRQVAPVGRCGQQHGRFMGEQRREAMGPRGGLEVAQFHQRELGGDAGQLGSGLGKAGAGEQCTPGAFGHGLRPACRQLPGAHHHHCDHRLQNRASSLDAPHGPLPAVTPRKQTDAHSIGQLPCPADADRLDRSP